MKNILITGASRGIGRAIAEIFAKGNRIFITGRNEEKLKESVNIIEKKGGEAVTINADFVDVKNVMTAFDNLGIKQLDLLVNNAGMAVVGALDEITIDDWQRTFDVNVTAPFLLIQKFHSIMPEGASIVNIASVASKAGFSNWSSYCMSKYALDGFTLSIREELRERKVRMINVYPGAVATDIWDDIPGEQDLSVMMKPEVIAEMVFAAVSQPSGAVIEDITIRNIQNF